MHSYLRSRWLELFGLSLAAAGLAWLALAHGEAHMILSAVGGTTAGTGNFATGAKNLADKIQPYVLAATPLGIVIAAVVSFADHRHGAQHFFRMVFVALLVVAAPTIAS